MSYILKSNKLILLLTLQFYAVSTFSQDIFWENSYGGRQSEYLLDVITTPDNGYLLAGSSISNKSGNITNNNKGNLDYWVWKMNVQGDIEWQKSFGGSGMDLLQSVKMTPDGGYILAGISNSNVGFDKQNESKGNTDYWIIKINDVGVQEWQRTIGGSGQEKINGITLTPDGGYILAGSSSSNKVPVGENNEVDVLGKNENSRGSLDYWVVKLTHDGNVDWQKTIGGKYKDELKSIVSLANNEYVLGGYSNSPISGEKTDTNIGIGDYWIVKINNTGAILWQQTIGGNLDDDLFILSATQDGGFIVGGNSNSSSSNGKSKSNTKGTDYWVVKMDKEGVIDWQETYNFGQTDVLSSIVENPDGSFLIAGYAQTEAKTSKALGKVKSIAGNGDKEGINDYVALKINPIGEKIWEKSVGSKGEEVMKKLYPTHDGGFLLAGTSFGDKSRDKKGKIGKGDFWVVKLKDKTKTEVNTFISASPNPAVNNTNIGINFQYNYGTVTLYDINGRQIRQTDVRGEHTIPMDMNNLPTGVYVIDIKTDGGQEGIKVIKK